MNPLDNSKIVEASIAELQTALDNGTFTCVDLVAHYLNRISTFDTRGPCLNSVPLLNPNVFTEAAASDDRRAAGLTCGPLEGIPFTVKDSYKVKRMTVAAGSPAFEGLIANEDAFTIAKLREAGAVLLGKTNMPPMAYGGMQSGIYGRAESPYNPDYLAAAYASGSSNGSAVATAANFAAFGMGEETVSSGRSPASNNALVAYTPSRGVISVRGNWPLYVTCDVVVPHTRTIDDMLAVLEVVAVEDVTTKGDFWRDQPFVELSPPQVALTEAVQAVKSCKHLGGVRIAVPTMYIGGHAPADTKPVTVSCAVIDLWTQARRDLEALGAEVVVVADFPVVTAYENPNLLPEGCPCLPEDWHSSERGALIAHGWNDFLAQNGQRHLSSIDDVDTLNIYPDFMRTPAELKVLDKANMIHWARLAEFVHTSSLYEVKNLSLAVEALEGMRKVLLEDWLTSVGCDCVVFPSAGDVGKADADTNDESAEHAWRNGVHYSNGNRALRHLGVPTVSIPMGMMKEKDMPVSLTFAGRANDDVTLLKYAHAYEARTKLRVPPPLTPALESGKLSSNIHLEGISRPILQVAVCYSESNLGSRYNTATELVINGTISSDGTENLTGSIRRPVVDILVDGQSIPPAAMTLNSKIMTSDTRTLFEFTAGTWLPVQKQRLRKTMTPVAGDKIMIVVLARWCDRGRPSGYLELI